MACLLMPHQRIMLSRSKGRVWQAEQLTPANSSMAHAEEHIEQQHESEPAASNDATTGSSRGEGARGGWGSSRPAT